VMSEARAVLAQLDGFQYKLNTVSSNGTNFNSSASSASTSGNGRVEFMELAHVLPVALAGGALNGTNGSFPGHWVSPTLGRGSAGDPTSAEDPTDLSAEDLSSFSSSPPMDNLSPYFRTRPARAVFRVGLDRDGDGEVTVTELWLRYNSYTRRPNGRWSSALREHCASAAAVADKARANYYYDKSNANGFGRRWDTYTTANGGSTNYPTAAPTFDAGPGGDGAEARAAREYMRLHSLTHSLTHPLTHSLTYALYASLQASICVRGGRSRSRQRQCSQLMQRPTPPPLRGMRKGGE
jgi:hypothetical protein